MICHKKHDSTPDLLTHLLQRPQNLTDLEDLVHLTVAREQGSDRVQLRHDASHGPDVDGRTVGVGLEQNLWGTVPVVTTREDIYRALVI